MLDEGILFYASIDGLLIFKGSIPSDPCNIPKRPLKDCLIGVDDNKAVGPTFRSLVITRLMSSSETKYPLNVPSVAGGIKVLQGKLAAYVTSNARWCDAWTDPQCRGIASECRQLCSLATKRRSITSKLKQGII
jgi:hypothetical protein